MFFHRSDGVGLLSVALVAALGFAVKYLYPPANGPAKQLCVFEAHSLHEAAQYVFDAMYSSSPLSDPDGPRLMSRHILDVIADSTGTVGMLPVLQAGAILADGKTKSHAQLLRSLQVPFVVRGHVPAINLDSFWRSPADLCRALPALCDHGGTRWEHEGNQLNHCGTTTNIEHDAKRRCGTTNATVNMSLRQWLSESDAAPAPGLGDTWSSHGFADDLANTSLLQALQPILDPIAGMGAGSISQHRLRVGRSKLISNFHFDVFNNWILAVAGSKRAVLLHPYDDACLQVEENESRSSWRNSPLPVQHAKEWLKENCLEFSSHEPRALQHRFEEGDLLFIPAYWLHFVETSASPTNGWWVSLNHENAETQPVGQTQGERELLYECICPLERPLSSDVMLPWCTGEFAGLQA
ncbi:unnamed protein product [Polarella glacialis]|uniref:JmjC domain-containing protein n=1 Tax=Polarella glacialis TaxID=89957 RepID=A0A813E9L3_POLGL|nr:unnamed protein product [Polarella glacialis]